MPRMTVVLDDCFDVDDWTEKYKLNMQLQGVIGDAGLSAETNAILDRRRLELCREMIDAIVAVE